MQIKEVVPTPAPVPPSTFDLTGVTLSEMRLLRYLLGRAKYSDDEAAGVPARTSYVLYAGVNTALAGR